MQIKIFSILIFLIATNVYAHETLPQISCVVTQRSGNFNTFIAPEIGDRINLDLGSPDNIIQQSRLQFSHGYISMNDMAVFQLEKILASTHDGGGFLLKTSANNRTVKIAILRTRQADRYDGWIINESVSGIGSTLGILGLSCNQI